MTSNLTIRTASAADREPLVAVVVSDDTFKPTEVEVAVELIDASLAGSSDYALLVCEHEGKIAGYICYGPTPMTDATYDLYWVVVHKEARGLGIARQLVAKMEHAVLQLGGRNVRVETSETEGYGAARRLYAKLEYPEIAFFPNFYSQGDALIVYYKTL